MSDRSNTADRRVAPMPESRPRRWDPVSMIAELESEMDRMFGRTFPFFAQARRRISPAMPEGWSPSTDIFEKNGELVVKVELPGVDKDQIDVSVENGSLVITGERKTEEEVKDEDYYRMERFSGSFYRRFPLPEGTDTDQITADYTDGVLEVHVPKPTASEPESKKIAVQ